MFHDLFLTDAIIFTFQYNLFVYVFTVCVSTMFVVLQYWVASWT